MANVLNEEKKQQVLALGRLGWSLRRIQQATRIRRETASAYLKAAGIAVRLPSGWGRHEPKPANEVITDFGAAKLAIPVLPDPLDPNCNPTPENLSTKGRAKATSKPANEVITDSAVVPGPSACEPYREAIDLGINRGRNARAIWQDWCPSTASPAATKVCNASCASGAECKLPRLAWSSSPRPARRRKSITAPVRWCATPRAGSTGAPGCS